jgi:fatty-acyl-CoA synthase
MKSMAEAWVSRAGENTPGLRYEDSEWTWAEVIDEASRRAGWWDSVRRPGPPHIAVLLDNVPEHVFWLGACAMAGSVYVGANPTHSGPAIAEELSFTNCQALITDRHHLELVEGYDLGHAIGVASENNPRIYLADGPSAPDLPSSGAPPDVTSIEDVALGFLIFTSGTSGLPKACRCTQGRMVFIGASLAGRYQFGSDTRCYLSMPLFHSNCLMSGLAPAVVNGATIVLPTGGRFSATGFLRDVRRHGVTYWNYVGRPLSYVLATPEAEDDLDNTLRDVFGNEAASADVERFARRFGCTISENYGSTEGGITVKRTTETPPGALGPAPPGILVVDEDGKERTLAAFDENGQLLNADDAVGELVANSVPANFEGYWENEEADRSRLRDGWYWSGDLAYRDAEGYLYFAGRGDDWLRVDGENFAAAPVMRIVDRHPDVVLSAVYAVPDAQVGDQVMAAVQLRPDARFDGVAFGEFLAAQVDLAPKWLPRYVRVSSSLPTTATSKVLVRQLRTEGLDCKEPVFELRQRDPALYEDRRAESSEP